VQLLATLGQRQGPELLGRRASLGGDVLRQHRDLLGLRFVELQFPLYALVGQQRSPDPGRVVMVGMLGPDPSSRHRHHPDAQQ
jgi:hypothetical protein